MSAVQGSKGILLRLTSIQGAPRAFLSTSTADLGSDVEPRRKGNLKDGINLVNMKRGTGYRSSFSGRVATVFGARGLIGTGVCNRLGKSGSQIIIPYRGDFYEYQRLKVCGDLGQVLFTPCEQTDEEAIRTAMKYSDVVINLIGREYETLNYKFHDINVKVPANLARIAKEMGVERFIHISSINASPNPQTLFFPGGSNWLKTKYEGERAVLKEFPEATIFRPCEMYGAPDHFIDYYNTWGRKPFEYRNMALWRKGKYTVRWPLHNMDLVTAIMNALDNPASKGEIFEAMGPEPFQLGHLMNWMHEVMHKDSDVDLYNYKLVDLRFNFSTFAKSAIGSFIPGGIGNRYSRAPTLERLERSQLCEASEGLPSIEELGVSLAKVEDEMPWYLEHYRAYKNHKTDLEEEMVTIHPLVPMSTQEAKLITAEAQSGQNMIKAIGLN